MQNYVDYLHNNIYSLDDRAGAGGNPMGENELGDAGDQELLRLEHWVLVGHEERRLLGLVVECNDEMFDQWYLTAPLKHVDSEEGYAETRDGAVLELGLELPVWSAEARAALRSLAQAGKLRLGDLAYEAYVRRGEDLGGIADDVWVRACEMARTLGVHPPKRNLPSIRRFHMAYGVEYQTNMDALIRERNRRLVAARQGGAAASRKRWMPAPTGIDGSEFQCLQHRRSQDR